MTLMQAGTVLSPCTLMSMATTTTMFSHLQVFFVGISGSVLWFEWAGWSLKWGMTNPSFHDFNPSLFKCAMCATNLESSNTFKHTGRS